MSLKGSLETVALPDVLRLLADTSKSGELLVENSQGEGRLWFDGGAVSGFEVGRSRDTADALFELLRLEGGDFYFNADAAPAASARRPICGREDVQAALETAQARFDQWSDILRVLPSLAYQVRLVPVASGTEIVLTSSQWGLLVAVGEGRAVSDVLARCDLPEFEGCQSVKDMVDAALFEVCEPVVDAEADQAVDEEGLAGDEDQDDGEYELEDEAQPGSGRAALEALLAQMNPTLRSAAPADEAGEEDGIGADVDTEGDDDVTVDGLLDRGPWTSRELEQMSEWNHDESEVPEPDASAFHPGSDLEGSAHSEANGYEAGYDAGGYFEDEGYVNTDIVDDVDDGADAADAADAADEAESEPAEQPLNRGLLLKFLSSVRS